MGLLTSFREKSLSRGLWWWGRGRMLQAIVNVQEVSFYWGLRIIKTICEKHITKNSAGDRSVQQRSGAGRAGHLYSLG